MNEMPDFISDIMGWTYLADDDLPQFNQPGIHRPAATL